MLAVVRVGFLNFAVPLVYGTSGRLRQRKDFNDLKNLAPNGESEDNLLLKDPKILQRLQDIQKLSDTEQEHIFITLDALIRDFKNKKAYT
jgi:hypothetical protein